MIDDLTMKQLQKVMQDRRYQILDLRDSLRSSRQTLQERENEIEEMAGKEAMLDGVDRMDERVFEELRKIEDALANIRSGHYGRCEICKRPIAAKRLQAIPWTTVCKRCALNRERMEPFEEMEDDLPDEQMSDAQIVQLIWDELDLKDELNLEHLRISSSAGSISLSGSVTTDKEHQLVLEIVEEDLGYEDVIDRIDIAPTQGDLDALDEEDEGFERESA